MASNFDYSNNYKDFAIVGFIFSLYQNYFPKK